MRTKSKLFLKIAIIIAGIGAIFMLTGFIISSVSHSQLFSSKIGDGKGYTYDIKEDIDKIKINTYNAEINIIGNSEKAYIEIINFNENMYTYQVSSSMLSFKESDTPASSFQFWDGDFSFKGLRYLFTYKKAQINKKINIYITKDFSLTDMNITTKGGKISISDFDENIEYNIYPEGASTSLSNISTKKAISVTGSVAQANIALNDVCCDTLKINSSKSEISGNINCDTLSIVVETGSVKLKYNPRKFTECVANISVNSKLVINSVSYSNQYIYPDEAIETTDKELNQIIGIANISGNDLSVDIDCPIFKVDQIETEKE